MHNQHSSRRMLQNIEGVVPQPENSRVARGASLSKFVCLSLLATSLLFIGNNAQAQDTPTQQVKLSSGGSGFLGSDYSKLQPDPKNKDLLIYWKHEDSLKNTSKFMLDPIIVFLLPEAQQRGIEADQLAELTQNFTKAITDELTGSGRYEVVTEPGPGTMLLQIAITNLEPTGGKTNAAVKGAATAASVAVAPGASLLVPRFSVGKISIEGRILDSVSGETQVEFMTSKTGKRYFSGLKAYQSWGDINAAFKSWAKGFRERLDKAHES
jgi:hypothetical protein